MFLCGVTHSASFLDYFSLILPLLFTHSGLFLVYFTVRSIYCTYSLSNIFILYSFFFFVFVFCVWVANGVTRGYIYNILIFR